MLYLHVALRYVGRVGRVSRVGRVGRVARVARVAMVGMYSAIRSISFDIRICSYEAPNRFGCHPTPPARHDAHVVDRL